MTALAFLLGLTVGLPSGILLAGILRAAERPTPPHPPERAADTFGARRWL